MSDTSAAGISALTGTFIGLSVVAVGSRFCARHKLKAPFMVDDWLMLLALASFIGLSALVLRLVHIKVLGYSSFQFTAAEKIARYDVSVKLQTALVALILTCLACTKASALLFYKRIFCIRGQRRGIFDILLIASIVIVACWFITFLFLDIFQCKGRFSGLWNPTVYKQECGVTWRFLYGFSVSDVLLDVLVLVLPIPSILRLHIALPKKLSILAIFMLACVALAASLVRMVIYIRIYILGVDKYNNLDSEHILTQYVFYYVLECGCSVVAINLPSVWPLISGRGLESIMKMARSVTSLASRSSQSSQRYTSKSAPTERSGSRGLDAVTSYGEKPGNAVDIKDLPASEGPISARLEILRQDSVQISSELRKPEDAHWKEEGW